MKQIKSHKTFGGMTQFWEHDSEATQSKMRFSTFKPETSPKGCIIWLSGLTCTEENFIMKAGAQRALSQHNLMVICPDTSPRGLNLPGDRDDWQFGEGAGFYVDATTPAYRTNYRMYSYVTQEIYELIHKEFNISNVSIMGHSMGGHGALVIGLREAAKFRSVSALAPIVNPTQSPSGINAFRGYLGDDKNDWSPYDAVELIKAGYRHPNTILVDQGDRDESLEKSLLSPRFKEACDKYDQPIAFNMRQGYDHSYYFVSSFIDDHIAHHAAGLS
jgi:S-formylglutathione hydrolase